MRRFINASLSPDSFLSVEEPSLRNRDIRDGKANTHTLPHTHTLVLCDVKLITLPLSLSASRSLSVALRCESDYGGWRIRWFLVCMCVCVCVCVCMCGNYDDGMLRDRRKVRHGGAATDGAAVCHHLSAVFSSGCVTEHNLWLNME